MKKINNCWVDIYNNKWNINFYTKEQAEKESKSLINCSYCSDCSGCSYCSGCSGCSENPQRIVSNKIGSRKSQTSVYWASIEDTQVVCGCYKGNLREFELRVKKAHKKGSIHYIEYMNFIKIVKYVIKNTTT